MNLLPFLLGATIIFWGWQTGLWLAAIPLAIICEVSRYVNWRWQLNTADFRAVSHVCTVLLVGVLIYLFISDRSLGLIFSFFQWLPIICAPLVVAQTYSTSDRVDLNALLFFKDKIHQKQLLFLNLTYPYFAVCILAASAANTRNSLFYAGVVILVSTALIPVKSKRFSSFVFFTLLLLAATLGTVGHIGLHQLHLSLEKSTARFFYGFYRPHTDPNQVSTAIGDIGSVKQSNKIVLRVKPAPQQLAPELLRRAVYNKYASGFWVAAQPEFASIESGKEQNTWVLSPSSPQPQEITVSEYMEEGSTLLKLPSGSSKVSNLPLEKIQQNQFGTVQIHSDESFLAYQIEYNSDLSTDSPPTEADLVVLDLEKPALDRIITQLDLASKTPEDILSTVKQFFSTEFEYSLDLARQGNNKTPLAAFLSEHRSGHCEYFATATALLLRRVGIPTRYVVGYSVHELSQLEKQYIVRSRNAHAWTQVYVNNQWQTFDTTPASWIAFEDRDRSNWQDIKDIFAWIGFKLIQIVTVFKTLGKGNYLWLLAIPLAIIFIRQFINRGQKRRLIAQRINRKDLIAQSIGADSELYLIEQELNKLGWQRDRSQTWQSWLIELQGNTETSDIVEGLESIVQMHYRYCFDPHGIDAEGRENLRSACYSWIEQHQKRNSENVSQ
ncbi:MAG: transglutaminase-like domain-containing protein [Cyanobacteria bacterium P01_G01_bin.19]